MRVQQIKAFKSNDGCIWETEEEAIVQNIEECIDHADICHGDARSTIIEKLRSWFKDHPADVRYILANIKKV